MKNKSFILIFVSLLMIFPNFIIAEDDLIPIRLPQRPCDMGPRYTILKDVNCLYIKWENTSPDLSFTAAIEQKIKDIFKQADINVLDTTFDENTPMGQIIKKKNPDAKILKIYQYPYVTPEFRIDLEIVSIQETNQAVYRLGTSFAKKANLDNGPKVEMMSNVWEIVPAMRLVAISQLERSITELAVWDAKAFVSACKEAKKEAQKGAINEKEKQLNKSDDKKIKSDTQQNRENEFVASKKGKVFHKPECRSAARIAAENLVNYDNREAAIAAGKRPCKQCNP